MKILLLHASAGAGHRRAAEALAKAFQAELPSADVKTCDILDFTPPLFRKTYAQGYLDLVRRAPELWGYLYSESDRKADEPWRKHVRTLFNKLNAASFFRFYRGFDPDIAVCTHFMPLQILAERRRRGRDRAPVFCAVTDFAVHALWIMEPVDGYYVATEEAMRHLLRKGVPRDRIAVTGIPIDPVFEQGQRKQDALRALGLDDSLPLVLLLSGGFGVGPAVDLIRSFGAEQPICQLLVVAGANERLKEQAEQVASSVRTPVYVRGFVKNIHEMMDACDLVITKPGGLTTSEVLAKGKPMLIIDPIPGQEQRNCEIALEAGLAARLFDIEDAYCKVRELLGDKARLSRMGNNARKAGHPRAAAEIARDILRRVRGLSGETASTAQPPNSSTVSCTISPKRRVPSWLKGSRTRLAALAAGAKLVTVLALGVLTARPASGLEPATGRLARVEADISQTAALLNETTNAAERAQWQRRLDLLQMDRSNLQTRFMLDAKERQLAGRQMRNASFALRQALRSVSVDTAAVQGDIERLNAALVTLRAQRADLEKSRPAAGAEGDAAEQQADIDQQLRQTDEEIVAKTLERESQDTCLRLGAEAARIEESLRSQPVASRLTLRLLRERKRQETVARTQVSDQDEIIALHAQRRAEIAAALALSRQRVAAVDADIDLLGKKNQGVTGWFKSRPLYYAATTEKKHLAKRVACQEQQLAAIDRNIALNMQVRDLYAKEAAYLAEDLATLTARYRHSLLFPAGAIAGILLVYAAIAYVVLPSRWPKERLIVGRRMASYLSGFLVLVVVVTFFFEDLKSIATVLGIAGAAVVIALQDMCSAIAGWFVIMTTRKMAVGHRVQIDEHIGDVLDIELLETSLLEVNNWLGVDEPTGRVIAIPNSFVFKSKLSNYTYMHPFVWSKVDVMVTFETPWEDAQRLLRRILEEETRDEFDAARQAGRNMERHYGVSDATYDPKFYTTIEDSGVSFRLLYVAHYKRVGAVRSRINQRVLAEFARDPRMQLAYPTQRLIPTPEDGRLRVALDRAPENRPGAGGS